MRKSIYIILLLIHIGLGVWAVMGLAEWVELAVPWRRVSNPLFPQWLLLLHWLVVASAAVVFIWGYVRRSDGLWRAMLWPYGLMAGVCAIETFGYLTHGGRFGAIAAEYLAYAGIVWWLRKHRTRG